MRVSDDCYECLQRLAYQAAGLATSDEQVKARAIEESLKMLRDGFSSDRVSIVIATKIHDVIKEITENPDPYREMKDKEIAVARGLSIEAKLGCEDDFEDWLRFAALGNAIDFFRPLDDARRDAKRQTPFS